MNSTLGLAPIYLSSAALFALLPVWDELSYAPLLTARQHAKTATVAIADIAGGKVADYGLIAGSGVLAAVSLLIGLLIHRATVSGLTQGGVKG